MSEKTSFWGFEGKAFSRCVVVALDQGPELVGLDRCQVGLSRQEGAHPSDGVFDAALLPGCVRIAEEGAQAELATELVVQGELGAVVEGERAAQ